jgi:hypothetical protein
VPETGVSVGISAFSHRPERGPAAFPGEVPGGWSVDEGEALSARLVTVAEDGTVECDDRIRAVAA